MFITLVTYWVTKEAFVTAGDFHMDDLRYFLHSYLARHYVLPQVFLFKMLVILASTVGTKILCTRASVLKGFLFLFQIM